MKLIDKIKNYFYDEDETNESKKEVSPKPAPSKPQPEEKEEKKAEPKKSENLDVVSERELFKSEPTFNFPIIFDEEDFKTDKQKNNRINTIKKEQTKIEVEKTEKKSFMPSPNISPIYGVIKDEASSKTKPDTSDNLLNLYEDNKKVDIDDILGKVYEQTRVEIKHETYEEVKTEPVVESKEDLSIDFFDNDNKKTTHEKVEVKIKEKNTDEDEVDKKLKSIDELLENTSEEDFYSLVDSMYKDEDEDGDN